MWRLEGARDRGRESQASLRPQVYVVPDSGPPFEAEASDPGMGGSHDCTLPSRHSPPQEGRSPSSKSKPCSFWNFFLSCGLSRERACVGSWLDRRPGPVGGA